MDTYQPPRKPRKTMQDAPIRCHRCRGSGMVPCAICGGSGQVLGGGDRNGNPTFRRCDGCLGRKNARCSMCHGTLFLPT